MLLSSFIHPTYLLGAYATLGAVLGAGESSEETGKICPCGTCNPVGRKSGSFLWVRHHSWVPTAGSCCILMVHTSVFHLDCELSGEGGVAVSFLSWCPKDLAQCSVKL